MFVEERGSQYVKQNKQNRGNHFGQKCRGRSDHEGTYTAGEDLGFYSEQSEKTLEGFEQRPGLTYVIQNHSGNCVEINCR